MASSIQVLHRSLKNAIFDSKDRSTDLKPDNIVMSCRGKATGDSSKMIIKLIDFGHGRSIMLSISVELESLIEIDRTASDLGGDRSHEISSILYRSPEAWFRMPWSFGADIWSLGIIVRFSRPCAGSFHR